jgi:serine/threonine protein phosphatase PrpC
MTQGLFEERVGPGWSAASYTHPGSRPNNEDTVGMAADGDRACFVLSDGLGGHSGGERASSVAVATAIEYWRSHPLHPARELLSGAVEAAHAAVRKAQRADKQFADMRTTIVMLTIAHGSAAWAHVGDSRLYLLSDGRIAAQTKDHSVPQFLVTNGELEPKDIRNHPDRSRLLGTLGNDEDLVYPSIKELGRPLAPTDRFLLCSDGLWEDVLESEIERTVAQSGGPRAWLEAQVALVEAAGREGRDNCTACAVWAGQPPKASA